MIKLVAILCSLAIPDKCKEVLVASSDSSDLTMTSCLVGEPALVGWALKNFPQYRFIRWKCKIGGAKGRDA